MEKARMERVDNQAEDRDLAARTTNRANRKVRKENAEVEVPAKGKAGVAAADRDKVAVREAGAVAGAVKTVEPN